MEYSYYSFTKIQMAEITCQECLESLVKYLDEQSLAIAIEVEEDLRIIKKYTKKFREAYKVYALIEHTKIFEKYATRRGMLQV